MLSSGRRQHLGSWRKKPMPKARLAPRQPRAALARQQIDSTMSGQDGAADQQVGCSPSLSDGGERAAHASARQDEDVMSRTVPRVAPEVRNLRREVPTEACSVAAGSEVGAQRERAPDLSGCLRARRPSNAGV